MIFSNATFHWVADHRRLFQNLHAWLAPGGRLVAQCGGAGNLRRIEALSPLLSRMPDFRPHLEGFRRPVHYASTAATARLLRGAGFREIQVWLHDAPTPFTSRTAFKDFIRNVICVPNLSRLVDDRLKEAYLETLADLYEEKFGLPYLLDYVRLNISARRGSVSS